MVPRELGYETQTQPNTKEQMSSQAFHLQAHDRKKTGGTELLTCNAIKADLPIPCILFYDIHGPGIRAILLYTRPEPFLNVHAILFAHEVMSNLHIEFIQEFYATQHMQAANQADYYTAVNLNFICIYNKVVPPRGEQHSTVCMHLL